jgi:hypothetical protein
MSDWLSDVIGDDLITVYEGLYFRRRRHNGTSWLRKSSKRLSES